MNKKGFTLIELLAVIVILAIIALIATPIVLNIIKDTRESAGLRSAEMYLDAVEQTVSIEKMNNTGFNPSACTIKEDGNLTCEGTNVQVEVKGEKPLKGNIVFESGKIIKIRLEYKNNKIILKNEKGNLEYFDYNRNSDINFVVEGIKEQKTTTGKNLFDINSIEVVGSRTSTYEIKEGKIVIYPTGEDEYPSISIQCPINVVSGKYIGIRIEGESKGVESIPSYQLTYPINYSAVANKGFSIKLTDDMEYIKFLLMANVNAESTEFSNIIVTASDTEHTLGDYEPYTGGKPSPNPEYPQEIPLTGTLNQKTGKYDINVTASTDDGTKSKSITLTSPVQLTKWDKLVKKAGVWGWSIRHVYGYFDGTDSSIVINKSNYPGKFVFTIPSLKGAQHNVRGTGFCNIAQWSSWGDVSYSFAVDGNGLVFFRYSSEDMAVDEFKAKIAETPIIIYNRTNNNKEVDFYPLPEEEQNLLYNLKF